MNANFNDFSNLYPLSKTLRFELIPQGQTLEYIQQDGLLEEDEVRAQDYKIMKKLLDEYHKMMIESVLSDQNSKFELDYLEDFKRHYGTLPEQRDDKEYGKISQNLRKKVKSWFEGNELYKKLKDNKKFIKEELAIYLESIDINTLKNISLEYDKSYYQSIIKNFEKFTTYFTGFNQNRENIYSDEDKSTAISNRIIHENLPCFIDNLKIYQKVKERGMDTTKILELCDCNLDEVFSLDGFNNVLAQSGIDKYNLILGGQSDGKVKKQGLNELINLYNQQQKDKKDQIDQFKTLKKQILSDRSSLSFIPIAFETDQELVKSVSEFYTNLGTSIDTAGVNTFELLKKIIDNLDTYDKDRIYIDQSYHNSLSKSILGDWESLSLMLEDYHKINVKKSVTLNKWKKQVSLQLLDDLCREKIASLDDENGKNYMSLIDYFQKNIANLIQNIDKYYLELKPCLTAILDQPDNDSLNANKEVVGKIKLFLDSIMNLFHLVKLLSLKQLSGDKDQRFYLKFELAYTKLREVSKLYDLVRNYLTKKPYSLEKIKLNFENATLLQGWDVNKEKDNSCVILRKGEVFYLGILDKKNGNVLERDTYIAWQHQQDKSITKNEVYEKMFYKLLPGANKMLPKVFLSDKGIKHYQPSQQLLVNYENGTHKKGDNFNLKDCHQLINFFKDSISQHPDWKVFGFKFSDTSTYNDISAFYREVENQGYKLWFENIDARYVNEMVDQGKLYLFKLYNKDFSEYSKGTPNLHTFYWKALFAEDNLKNVIYKLNGEAEIFYRKKSIDENDIIKHVALEAINNKNPKNSKTKSLFNYDLIKDKRFTLDKFQFHVPITLNFKATGSEKIDKKVNEYLKQNYSNTYVIGIDRGERHLLYVSVIDPQGQIIEQYSLNEIVNSYNNQDYKVDYHNLLDKKEKERKLARENWGIVANIKELKSGYLSQVVNKISKLMVKHKAVIVMEDLNSGFKNSRFKVEKQVYQKFEKMLIDKLNYLVFKNPVEDEPSIYNALQLTSKFKSFKEMGRQNGFILYIPAWNTSKIDPTTGFVDLLKPKYENIKQVQEFFGCFDQICFNANKDYFEFKFNYKKFKGIKVKLSQEEWTICSTNEDRYFWDNNNKSQKKCLITQELKKLLGQYHVNYQSGENVKNSICSQVDKKFFSTLIYLLRVTLALRYNNGKSGDEEEDYILSPVANSQGVFFDSRRASDSQPKDADANGAYNIARKGLMAIQEIVTSNKFIIINEKWLKFAQSKENCC